MRLLCRSLSPFLPRHIPPTHLLKGRNIARRFYSSVPFSEKRDLHLFVRFIHVTYTRSRARTHGRFTFIYTNVYGGISTHFPSRSVVIFFSFFFLFFFFCSRCSPLQKRELYGLSNETPDRYRRVSRDNSFFYHSGTTAVAWVKRSCQHIHATRNCFFFSKTRSPESFEQKYSLLMNLSSCRKYHCTHHIKSSRYLFFIFRRFAIFIH